VILPVANPSWRDKIVKLGSRTKKITWRDGLTVLGHTIRYSFID
jgi:hypothetical protein